VANQAQDPKGSGAAGYAIGDLDVGAKPTRSPSGQHASIPEPVSQAQPAVRAQSLAHAKPANTQSHATAAKPKAAKVAGGGQIAAFDDEPAHGGELGLELDLDTHKGKKAAPSADTSAQMGYGGKSIGDGFGDPESGPALDIEQVDRRADNIKNPTRDAKAEAQKEFSIVAQLASFGDVPSDLIGSARYAVTVLRRTMALKRDQQKAVRDTQGLEADLNTALVEMGQAIMAMKSEPQVAGLRSQIAMAIDAQAKVSDADRSMSKTREQNQQLVAEMDKQAAELQKLLEPYLRNEQAALDAHKKAEEEVKRAQGLQRRSEIELRALGEAGAVQDPIRVEDLKGQLEERRAAVQKLTVVLEQASTALGATRRELALKKGALDALEDKKKKLLDETHKKEAEAEQKAKAAEGSHSAALRTLAESARTSGLAPKVVPEKNEWVSDVESAVQDARKIVQRFDRALKLYDKSVVTKGWITIGAIALLFIVAIVLGVRGGES
jgi:hypothetical protein